MSKLFLLLTALGCGSSAPAPVVAPAPVAEPEPLPPELMPDLAIPTSPDVVLGPMKPAPLVVSAYFPDHHVGDWQLMRVWASERGQEWRPAEIQIFHDRAVLPEVERHQLRPVGDEMRSFAGQKLKVVGPTWAVVASLQTGAQTFRPLSPPELLIAPKNTTFHSAWVGQMVTVEVLGVQEITVPAGTFQALRIRREWAQGNRQTSDEAWWTAERGMVARSYRVQTLDTPEVRLTVLAQFGTVEDANSLRQVWSDGRNSMGMPE